MTDFDIPGAAPVCEDVHPEYGRCFIDAGHAAEPGGQGYHENENGSWLVTPDPRPDTGAPRELRPAHAHPDNGYEYDEDGNKQAPYVGWDLAFGCRVSFGPDEDGTLRADVHMSDHEAAANCSVRSVTCEQVRGFANYLLAMVDELDEDAVVPAESAGGVR